MELIDSYGYAGFGTCIGVLLGLLTGFIIGQLAWSMIICTAVGSVLGQVKDFQITPFGKTQPTNLDD